MLRFESFGLVGQTLDARALPFDLGETVKEWENYNIHPRVLDNVAVELVKCLTALSPILPNVVIDPWGTVGTNGQATGKDYEQ